jgi:hypothetical protein
MAKQRIQDKYVSWNAARRNIARMESGRHMPAPARPPPEAARTASSRLPGPAHRRLHPRPPAAGQRPGPPAGPTRSGLNYASCYGPPGARSRSDSDCHGRSRSAAQSVWWPTAFGAGWKSQSWCRLSQAAFDIIVRRTRRRTPSRTRIRSWSWSWFCKLPFELKTRRGRGRSHRDGLRARAWSHVESRGKCATVSRGVDLSFVPRYSHQLASETRSGNLHLESYRDPWTGSGKMVHPGTY